MIDITINGNYIYFTNSENNIVTDRPISDITIVKKYSYSTDYTVYYKGGSVIDGLCNIEFTNFSLNGSPFTDNQVFEDWKNQNTSSSNIGQSDSSPITETNLFPTGLNTNVPAGYRSVTISRLTGLVTIDLGDGTFQLGGGSIPRAIGIEGDTYGNEYGVLPAVTISGGTWQWIATQLV